MILYHYAVFSFLFTLISTAIVFQRSNYFGASIFLFIQFKSNSPPPQDLFLRQLLVHLHYQILDIPI